MKKHRIYVPKEIEEEDEILTKHFLEEVPFMEMEEDFDVILKKFIEENASPAMKAYIEETDKLVEEAKKNGEMI